MDQLYSILGQRMSQGDSNKSFVDEVMHKDFSAEKYLNQALEQHHQAQLLAASETANIYKEILRDERYYRETEKGEFWFDSDSAQSEAQWFVQQSREYFFYNNRIHLLVEDLIEAVLFLKPNSLDTVCRLVEIWEKHQAEDQQNSPWLEIFQVAGLNPKVW
jgi:hypothetical protein